MSGTSARIWQPELTAKEEAAPDWHRESGSKQSKLEAKNTPPRTKTKTRYPRADSREALVLARMLEGYRLAAGALPLAEIVDDLKNRGWRIYRTRSAGRWWFWMTPVPTCDRSDRFTRRVQPAERRRLRAERDR